MKPTTKTTKDKEIQMRYEQVRGIVSSKYLLRWDGDPKYFFTLYCEGCMENRKHAPNGTNIGAITMSVPGGSRETRNVPKLNYRCLTCNSERSYGMP